MAPHSSIPAWRIPWTEGPGGLQSVHRATQSDAMKLTQQRPPRSTLPGAQLQWGDAQWLPSQRGRSLPPTSLCSSETDLGDVHSDQEGADPSPDRAVTTTEGRPRSTSHAPHPWTVARTPSSTCTIKAGLAPKMLGPLGLLHREAPTQGKKSPPRPR